MKKILAFCIILAVCSFSCKKESKNEDFHITCKIDGESKSFNSVMLSGNLINNDKRGFVITGQSKLSAEADAFGVVIVDPENDKIVTTGTYTDGSSDYQVLATYHQNENNGDYEAGYEMYNNSVRYSIPIKNNFTITISSLDQNTARGTFSGDFFLDGNLEGNKRTITEGSFYVQLAKE